MKHHEVARKLRRAPKSEARDEAFRRAIRAIPRGKVATYFQKQMAQESLRSIEGVQHIENQLEVCWA